MFYPLAYSNGSNGILTLLAREVFEPVTIPAGGTGKVVWSCTSAIPTVPTAKATNRLVVTER